MPASIAAIGIARFGDDDIAEHDFADQRSIDPSAHNRRLGDVRGEFTKLLVLERTPKLPIAVRAADTKNTSVTIISPSVRQSALL